MGTCTDGNLRSTAQEKRKTIETTTNRQIDDKELTEIIKAIKKNYNVNFFLLPDHFHQNVNEKINLNNQLTRVLTDPDMTLAISSQWTSFEYYTNDLSSKYKKRTRSIFKKGGDLKIKKLSKDDVFSEIDNLKILYENVYNKSSFSGPKFDISIYLEFLNDEFLEFNTYGFFINNTLIGFSSEIITGTTLYSYFIGIDYSYNTKYDLYNRMLYHTLESGIEKHIQQIKFGRTAAEIKSTVGAVPSSSIGAVYIENKLLNLLFKPFIKSIKPKSWVQRSPFKKQ